MKIAIIANGTIKSNKFHKDILKGTDAIIAADGGADHCIRLGVSPDYVIGDLDSISKKSLRKFYKKIIHDKGQNSTDLQKALIFAWRMAPDEVIVLGAIGERIDHTMANILCLGDFSFNIRVMDENNEIEIIENKKTIKGKKGDIISIIALTDVENLNYSGLKYAVKRDFNVYAGWLGTSNEMLGEKAAITLKKGKLILMRTKVK